jgi:hypothetical protein
MCLKVHCSHNPQWPPFPNPQVVEQAVGPLKARKDPVLNGLPPQERLVLIGLLGRDQPLGCVIGIDKMGWCN